MIPLPKGSDLSVRSFNLPRYTAAIEDFLPGKFENDPLAHVVDHAILIRNKCVQFSDVKLA